MQFRPNFIHRLFFQEKFNRKSYFSVDSLVKIRDYLLTFRSPLVTVPKAGFTSETTLEKLSMMTGTLVHY